jgi:PAS domain S-box-containing protein
MTGWSRAEVLGRSPRILQGPKTDLRVFADLREKLHSGAIWEGQTINYRKDGSEFWMEWSIVPLRNERGETIQYVAIQRDVSARVEAERRLQEAQDARSRADRARANLARYFSPKLVETLAAKDEPLGPVRRQDLAVLFADVVGFTALSESLEPEQVMELLRDIHSWMEKVVSAMRFWRSSDSPSPTARLPPTRCPVPTTCLRRRTSGTGREPRKGSRRSVSESD